MRIKSLLGLFAIGGAVAYAQRKRGGEFSVDGFRRTFTELKDRLMSSVDDAMATTRSPRQSDTDDLPSYASPGRVGTTTRSFES